MKKELGTYFHAFVTKEYIMRQVQRDVVFRSFFLPIRVKISPTLFVEMNYLR